jgi:hypothetical protein
MPAPQGANPSLSRSKGDNGGGKVWSFHKNKLKKVYFIFESALAIQVPVRDSP